MKMYDFGLRLKELRKARGLTQKMLADRISKSVSAVSSYELNIQLPPLDVAKSIAITLGISVDYLIGMEDIPTYSAAGLSEKQVNVLEKLMSEFLSPSNLTARMSDDQLRILGDIIELFTETN